MICQFAGALRGQRRDDIGLRCKIRKLRSILIEHIEPNVDLLTRLMSKELLSDRQFEKVRSKTSVYGKNYKLLKYLTDRKYNGDLSKVLKVFEKNGQKHVVNFIHSGGGT